MKLELILELLQLAPELKDVDKRSILISESFKSSGASFTPFIAKIRGQKCHLLLKEYNLEKFYSGLGELDLFSDLQKKLENPPIVKIFSTRIDEDSNYLAMIEEDLNNTHYPVSNSRKHSQYTLSDIKKIINSISQIHMAYWDDPLVYSENFLKPINGPHIASHAGSKAALFIYKDRIEETIPKFVELYRSKLTEDTILKLEQISHIYLKIFEKRISERSLTLIHGDFHPWNIALPKDKDGSVTILDWETFRRGLGSYDIAYLLMTCKSFQFISQSNFRDVEKEALMYYHKNLLNSGIKYEESQLILDYKVSLLSCLFFCIFQKVRRYENDSSIADDNSFENILESIEYWKADKWVR